MPSHAHTTSWLAGALLLLALSTPTGASQSGLVQLPTEFELVGIGTDYLWPVDIEFAPDGLLFVAEIPGTVRVHDGADEQDTPFVDLTDEVNDWGDRGLLALALHPGFVPDGGPTSWVYLLYTVSPIPGQDVAFDFDDQYSFSRLTRYRAVTQNGDVVADLASRQVLLGNQQPDGLVPDGIASLSDSHSNGSLEFGDDGSLLIATGDGARFNLMDTGGYDPPGFGSFVHPVTGLRGPMPDEQDSGSFRSQDLRSLAGKILRVDPETGGGYPSNPFFDGDPASNASRVWALGLRNPFRFHLVAGSGSNDPTAADPGELFLADVGAATWEELDLCKGGENFGWPCSEGPDAKPSWATFEHVPNPLGLPDCQGANPGTPAAPLLAYHHDDGSSIVPAGIYVDAFGQPVPGGAKGSCAISGAVYGGGEYPAEYVGRLFVADYADQWVRTLELDAQGQPGALRDFGTIPAVVDVEVHPLTGDLWLSSFGLGPEQVFRLRFSDQNLTPKVSATASPTFGPAPLAVEFDGSASFDPDGDPLTFEWDFGDGSPTSGAPAPQHVYQDDGLYEVTLRIEDPAGLEAETGLEVAVGPNTPPAVEITAPAFGQGFEVPATISVTTTWSDVQDASLAWSWQVDEHHDTHVHPSVATSTQPDSFSYQIGQHGGPSDLVYYSIAVTVTDSGGLSASDHVLVYPSDKLRDATGTAHPIARVLELSPPIPLGSGNPDTEVIRDGIAPAPGTADPLLQFDSFHVGDQGADDWIGYELVLPPEDELRFVGLTFTEGLHAADGGWLETLDVETRVGGVWQSVGGLRITPDYPFASAGQPFFDGQGFDTYTIDFDPAAGDAIRLRGDPGGSSGYLSVGELRARTVSKLSVDAPGFVDVTALGTPIAKVLELDPPGPTGGGSQVPGTIGNGTLPTAGSASQWAQFDSFHDGDQGAEDWIGYSFPTTQRFRRLVLQEGLNNPDGGWFDSLAVEVRAKDAASWTPVNGLTSSPPYPGTIAPGAGYETFRLDFEPADGREIRVVGIPGGSQGYVSVGELRVYTQVPIGCGWEAFGPGTGPADTLLLSAWLAPGLGDPIEMEVVGAPGAGIGWLVLSPGLATIPYGGGTILVDPVGAFLMLPELEFGADGEASWPLQLPSTPAFAGLTVAWQGFLLTSVGPVSFEYSNALEMTFCP